MIDACPQEKVALRHAARMTGEYLDSLPRTDLRAMSPEQYMTMIETVITAYLDMVMRFRLDGIPFEAP